MIHAIASAIVVVLLALLSGSDLAGAIGGFFFAMHPLRVESVVSIAERKDVLCTLFFAAALLAYIKERRVLRTASAPAGPHLCAAGRRQSSS